jgi:hypothetical protein
LGSVWIASERSVIDRVLSIAGLTTGLVLGLFILGSMRRPVSSNAALAGFGFGAVVVIGVWLPSIWGITLLAWPWYAPLGMIVTVSIAFSLDRLVFHGSPVNRSSQSGVGESR